MHCSPIFKMNAAGKKTASSLAAASWEAVIGIEVHAQLASPHKLFSPARSSSSGSSSSSSPMPPNCNVARLDASVPGSLPVLGWDCVERAVTLGLALGSRVQPRSSFDRKHYFYADMPAGYQITQHRAPLLTGGSVALDDDDDDDEQQGDTKKDGSRRVRLIQIQLEQDSAKSIHDQKPGVALVDLNRAGSALVEIVSYPDMRSSVDAAAYVRKLQTTLRIMGVSPANLEDGTMRCDVNVSVRPRGALVSGTRIELKNLNSIRAISNAIDYEVGIQVAALEAGGKVAQETRSFDPATGTTFKLRDKETARDYRYMPEPDLPDLVLTQAQIDAIRQRLPELLHVRQARLCRQFGLSRERAKFLLGERGAADFFERTMQLFALNDSDLVHKTAGNVYGWITSQLMGDLNGRLLTLDTSPVTPSQIASIVRSIQANVVSGRQAKEVLGKMLDGDTDLAEQ